MPVLTRRRSKDAHADSWQIFYGDVQVGTIGIRAGAPVQHVYAAHMSAWQEAAN